MTSSNPITNLANAIKGLISKHEEDKNHAEAGGTPKPIGKNLAAGTNNGYYARADHVHTVEFDDVLNTPNALNVVDNLTTNDGSKPLSAKQGKWLNDNKAQLSHNHDTSYISNSTGSVTSNHIADGTIVNTDIASNAAIAYSKLSGVAPSTHTHTDSQINFNGSGYMSPIDAALNHETSTNKIAFLPPNNLTVQYANSSTSTLTTYSVSDANKTKIMSASSIGGVPLVGGGGVGTISTSDKLVVTVDAGNITDSTASQVYTSLKKIHLYFSTGSCTGCQVKVETADYPTSTTWVDKGTYNLSGNPGWNVIPLNITFGGYAKQNVAGHVRYIKLTFTCTGIGNSSLRFALRNIQMFGVTNWTTPSNLASIGHIYNYNENQDAIFPAKIIKSGGTSSQFLKANGDVDSNTYLTTNNASSTYLTKTDASNTYQPKGSYAASTHTHAYAPTSHASTGTGYGVGTTANYGHNKIIDDATKSSLTNGESLSAHMGYILNNQDVEYVVSTHTSSTSTWTGTCSKIRKLEAGTKIYYRLNQDPTTTEVTLNLTLADSTTTGAKNVYFGGTRLKNQYPKYAVIGMVFDGSNWIVINQYTNTNTTYSVATQSANGLMSSGDKTKLDGVATGANNYSHPSTHAATMITDANAHTNIGSSANANQGAINTAIDTALSNKQAKGSYAAASHSHSYLPLTGGTLTGNVIFPDANNSTNNTAAGNIPWAGTPTYNTDIWTTFKAKKSGFYTFTDGSKWWNLISVRHRNGSGDATNYGAYIKTSLQDDGSLIWAKQKGGNSFMAERTILDSNNYSTYANKTSISAVSGVGTTDKDKIGSVTIDGLEYSWYTPKLNDTISSTSTDQAATANAVRVAYNKANHSHPSIANNLTTSTTGSVLDATQGKWLKDNTVQTAGTGMTKSGNTLGVKNFALAFAAQTGQGVTVKTYTDGLSVYVTFEGTASVTAGSSNSPSSTTIVTLSNTAYAPIINTQVPARETAGGHRMKLNSSGVMQFLNDTSGKSFSVKGAFYYPLKSRLP